MNKVLIEVCCGSAQDVFMAAKGGAGRVELNSGLFFGGLTPSIGTLIEAKGAGIPIMAMVRPRESGFCYSEREFSVMLHDTELLIRHGADGIVFGTLESDGSLNLSQLKAMLEVIGDRESVFHRAIDVVGDGWRSLMDTLIEHGVTRILTSGQRKTAMDGKVTIREMVEYSRGRIDILPGGNVRANNVAELLEFTGCRSAHTSGSKLYSDSTATMQPEISFTATEAPSQETYKIVDPEVIANVIAACK